MAMSPYIFHLSSAMLAEEAEDSELPGRVLIPHARGRCWTVDLAPNANGGSEAHANRAAVPSSLPVSLTI